MGLWKDTFVLQNLFQMNKNVTNESNLTKLGRIMMRRNTSQSFNQPNNCSSEVDNNNCIAKDRAREIRITIILFITVILYLVCWIPAVIVLALLIYNPYSISLYAMIASFAICPLNSIVDPFLYAFNIRGANRAAKKLLRRILCLREEEIKESTNCMKILSLWQRVDLQIGP